MPYDPNFISGFTVPLPVLGSRVQSVAFNGRLPIDHTRFSIFFNQERGLLIAGAHNIDGAAMIPEGRIERHGFRLDPEVPSNLQVDNQRGYLHNRWDRGHMVRRRSLHWGNEDAAREADRQSSFWTNIAPQHEVLHDTAWGDIEDWMLAVSDDVDRRACVFTGPVLTLDDPEHANQPGEVPVRIPAGYWKIFSVKHHGTLRAAAFLVWQRDFDKAEPEDFDPVLEQVRLTTIEHLTGLSFAGLREADPLHFGTGIDLRAASRRVSATASAHGGRPRPPQGAVIVDQSDIVL